MFMPQAKNLAPDLWIFDQPEFSTGFAKIGTRMTVIKLAGGGLFLHSPIRLDDETRRALDTLGEVTAVVAPSRAHHLFVTDYTKRGRSRNFTGRRDWSATSRISALDSARGAI